MRKNVERIARTMALSLVALSTGLIFSGAAQGQSAPEDSADGTKDDIVVTAQKRSERLLEVPASVSVIGAEALLNQGAKSLQDFAAYVPGLQIDSAGTPGQSTITLRGISPLGSGTAVGTYIDDAPLGSSGIYAAANLFQLDLLPYDLKGVEVLRGPQGTLYGASTMGGLLKYSLIEADSSRFAATVGGEANVTGGSDRLGFGVRGMINVPIVADRLAIRASAFHQFTPGFIDNVRSGEKDVNTVRQSGGRLAVAWTPASNLTVTVNAMHQRIEAAGSGLVPLDPTTQLPAFGDLRSSIAIPNAFTQTSSFLKGSINWDIDFATLTSVTSYSEVRSRQDLDITLGYGPVIQSFIGTPAISGQYLDINVKKFNQEVRLTSPSGRPVEWMIGAFYTLEKSLNNQRVSSLNLDGTSNALDPLLIASLPTRYQEVAVFGNVSVKLTDKLSVSGGLRYSRNEQRYQQFTSGAFGVGNGGGTSGENVATYSASAKYQFTPATMVYARVASGYQPGGPNVAAAGVPPTVGPSRLTNYETGIKTRAFNDVLTLELTGFRMDWNDIQVLTVTLPPSNISYLVNAGRARSQGAEGSAIVRPDAHLTLTGTLAYTDATFSVAIPSLAVMRGDRLPHVPKVSASGLVEYRTTVGNGWDGRIGTGLRYASARLSSAAPPRYIEDAYVAVDLNANVSSDHWRFGIFAKNLLDRRAYITKQDLIGATVLATVLQPRTIGISADYRF